MSSTQAYTPSGYTFTIAGIVTDVPRSRLCAPFAAHVLASVLASLYNKPVSVGPDPMFPNAQPTGPLAALAVTIPGEGTINAEYLIEMQSAPYADGSPSGFWKLDQNLGGALVWESLPPPQPAPGTSGVDPGGVPGVGLAPAPQWQKDIGTILDDVAAIKKALNIQ